MAPIYHSPIGTDISLSTSREWATTISSKGRKVLVRNSHEGEVMVVPIFDSGKNQAFRVTSKTQAYLLIKAMELILNETQLRD